MLLSPGFAFSDSERSRLSFGVQESPEITARLLKVVCFVWLKYGSAVSIRYPFECMTSKETRYYMVLSKRC